MEIPQYRVWVRFKFPDKNSLVKKMKGREEREKEHKNVRKQSGRSTDSERAKRANGL